MSVTVLKSGMLSTVQDRGRFGFQHFGVPVSGAMDLFSHRVANILVGNAADKATLEITLLGPRLRFEDDALIALCGADLSPVIGDRAVPQGKAVRVRRGAVLDFGTPLAGCRAYLAIQGGFDVPVVMGSRSTYETAGLGGVQGRALRAADVLPVGRDNCAHYPGLARELAGSSLDFIAPRWAVDQHVGDLTRSPQVVRIVAGRHWEAFGAGAREALTNTDFHISPESNRMGCRLESQAPLLGGPAQTLSEAVTFGTIQVPASGHPIVLMADRQTVGGYPKIADVAGVDLHLLAQMRPGERLRFERICLARAQALWLQREQEIMAIGEAVTGRLVE